MIVDIKDTLNEVGVWLEKFISNNYSNPFFWLILVGTLFLLATIVISRFADK